MSSTCWDSRMAHSRAVSVLYLLEPVGWLILELLVSSTCWDSRMAHSRAVSVLYLLEPVLLCYNVLHVSKYCDFYSGIIGVILVLHLHGPLPLATIIFAGVVGLLLFCISFE